MRFAAFKSPHTSVSIMVPRRSCASTKDSSLVVKVLPESLATK